ncbi:MAG TPA: cupin domain-containing protein [Gemmatimonadaceae bacterium]|jgi:mannose-6-phosphate isomerase-like protein (cupin superfamily)|nr:cupin domain-containing protein [Gemmatimonadota bacterium]HNV76483.1 cupin domain-containing protein [Gemmatimonadaceae bacterium]
MPVVNLADKFSRFADYWHPRIVGELNGQHVKVAKLLGEFDWHFHADEDELFLVIKGTLCMQLRDGDVTIGAGEFFIVPRGVEHRPVAEEEVHVVLFEPASTFHTGNVVTEKTRESLEWI